MCINCVDCICQNHCHKIQVSTPEELAALKLKLAEQNMNRLEHAQKPRQLMQGKGA
ncbi:hypothetical protein AAFX24_27805 [Vibrio mediterranei]|uniref:hypothetical protein n=1 Tax=Vibrio mediterranei TaxID=689 RepID=UPI0038CDE132